MHNWSGGESKQSYHGNRGRSAWRRGVNRPEQRREGPKRQAHLSVLRHPYPALKPEVPVCCTPFSPPMDHEICFALLRDMTGAYGSSNNFIRLPTPLCHGLLMLSFQKPGNDLLFGKEALSERQGNSWSFRRVPGFSHSAFLNLESDSRNVQSFSRNDITELEQCRT